MKTVNRIHAFSMLELVVSIAVMTMLMLLLSSMLGPVIRLLADGDRRMENRQTGRGALELIARELTPAVVDTRMQFVVMPGEVLAESGALNVAPDSPAILWMAPLGKRNYLHCVGYYLSRDPTKKRYRLKRLLISPENEFGYHPKVLSQNTRNEEERRTSPVDASWFTQNWDESAFEDSMPANEKLITSTVADRVIAFWIQCYDILGNPIPWTNQSKIHPDSNLIFNSASYFQMATTLPFSNDETFSYMGEHDLAIKANRLPAEIEIRLFTIDKVSLLQGADVPVMKNVMDQEALDLDASTQEYRSQLIAEGFTNARLFSTRVKLLNGS